MMKKPSSAHNSNKNQKTKLTAAGDVRIIGGQFKRRVVRFVDAEGLRPTPDRLRETLFNWLIANIHDAQVLDSCAGSGVLGFEALSRGAAHCTFIEMNAAQSQMLRQSAELLRLDIDSHQIIQGTAEQVLQQKQLVPRPFDIVFIDPPYAEDLWQPILTTLFTQDLIDTDTLIYLEADKELNEQLSELAAVFNTTLAAQKGTHHQTLYFDCLKQTKVGQVVAGLYRLLSS
ncbi:possible methyltransferase [Psychrobacter arcticus 273-4]|uniref:Ribosomal RNA small subunit methyltransferase D n=2 Tax=Psychrobacter arcticus TaxID=334543 RepID=Q4FRE6_PSYA2|nr:possible methyltransferase [Psychrobacter arcticus 273-4]